MIDCNICKHKEDYDYCPKCGQKIDWSDEE